VEAVNQLDIDWAGQRDSGIARATSHAEAIDSDWPAVAYGMLEEFCQARKGCHFTSEDVRRWCELRGFETAVPKAWGGVIRRAASKGLIKRVGIAIAKQRHGSPCPLWETA
jgi:hypothetical protein